MPLANKSVRCEEQRECLREILTVSNAFCQVAKVLCNFHFTALLRTRCVRIILIFNVYESYAFILLMSSIGVNANFKLIERISN